MQRQHRNIALCNQNFGCDIMCCSLLQNIFHAFTLLLRATAPMIVFAYEKLDLGPCLHLFDQFFFIIIARFSNAL